MDYYNKFLFILPTLLSNVQTMASKEAFKRSVVVLIGPSYILSALIEIAWLKYISVTHSKSDTACYTLSHLLSFKYPIIPAHIYSTVLSSVSSSIHLPGLITVSSSTRT